MENDLARVAGAALATLNVSTAPAQYPARPIRKDCGKYGKLAKNIGATVK